MHYFDFHYSWEQRKVREVTDRYDNLRIPVAASLRVAGTTPYYGANGIQDYVDGYTHDGEFILVAEDGANDLKNYPVKCVKGRIWVNNHAHVLQGKYDCADNQFLAYAISQADIESLLVGGGRAKLNAETLMGIDLLLPNKAEQIRIGKYLAQLDNLITLHQREFAFLCKEKSKKFRYIKNAWEQRKLGEIGSVSMCRRIFKEQTSENGEIPFYKIGTFGGEADAFISRELFEEYKAKYQYPKKGDILISASGSIGRTVVFTGKNEYFQDSNIVWLNHDKHLDNSFLKCFYSIVKWAGIEGSTIKRLYNDNILNTAITLPSVEEQQKIGAYFENLDNLITLHQREFAFLCKEKSKKFRYIKNAWEQRKFSDLVQIERGGSPRPIDDFITDSPDGLNWVKIGDAPAQGNYITKTAEKIKPEGLSKTREVHPGDLILSNSMSFGKPYIMGIDGCIHDGWLLIRNTYKVFDLTFLCHLLGTPQMIIQYKSLAAGSTVNNLNKELVGNTVVTIPTIKEQRVLGQYLETLDNLITLHQRKPNFYTGGYYAE